MVAVVERKVETILPTEFGDFRVFGYLGQDGKEHIALVKGNVHAPNILCRVHSECLTGEVFGSLKCDCREQLEIAFHKIEEAGQGIILYLRQEGRGIGIIEKLKAYKLQSEGRDTVEANIALGHKPDERDYNIAAYMLKDLGVETISIITNNPNKISQLESYGIKIESRVAVEPARLNKYNRAYLRTKIDKMEHIIKKL